MPLNALQETIMGFLKTYRCLKDEQIKLLISLEEKHDWDYLYRQIEALPKKDHRLVYRPERGMVAMINAQPDYDLLAAMDVMLSFRDHGLESYMPGKEPFKMTFIRKRDNGHFRVYHVSVIRKGMEYIVPQQAACARHGADAMIIFVLDDIAQSEKISFPYEHYYAVLEKDKPRFFKGVTAGT